MNYLVVLLTVTLLASSVVFAYGSVSLDRTVYPVPDMDPLELWNLNDVIIDGTAIDKESILDENGKEIFGFNIKVNEYFKGDSKSEILYAKQLFVLQNFDVDEGDNALFYLKKGEGVGLQIQSHSVKTFGNCDARSLIEIIPVLPNEKPPISTPTMTESYFDPCVADYFSYDPDFFKGIVNGISPIKQTQYGIPIEKIRCFDNFMLIQKHDGFPACVKPETFPKLIERGWGEPINEIVSIKGPVYSVPPGVLEEENQVIEPIHREDPQYLGTFQLSLDDNPSYNGARDMVVDSDGYIYVSLINNTVEKYDSEGNLLLVYGSSGIPFDEELYLELGYMSSPSGIAIDSDGKLYVLDSNNNRVQFFDSEGIALGFWSVSEFPEKSRFPWHPSELGIDNSKEFLYMVDGIHNNIQVLDKQGTLIEKLGRGGFYSGHFNNPGKISFDKQNFLYVADTGNDRIQIFDEELNFVSEKKGFADPKDVAFDSKGNIYVLENVGRHYLGIIKKFDPDWNKMLILTTRDFTKDYVAFEDYEIGFEDIIALDFGPDDTLYVLDRNQGVHKFAP